MKIETLTKSQTSVSQEIGRENSTLSVGDKPINSNTEYQASYSPNDCNPFCNPNCNPFKGCSPKCMPW